MIYFLLLVIIIVLLVMLTPVNIFVEYSREDKGNNLKIWLEVLFGVITYKLHIPQLELKKALEDPFLKLKAEIEATGSTKTEIEKEKSLSFKEMDWEQLVEQLQFMKGLVDQFEAIERVLDTFKDEIHRLDELTLRNPILLRIVSALVLGLQGKCNKFVWHTRFGIKDPAMTGVVSGVLWSIKGGICSFLSQRAEYTVKPDLEITPDFNQVNKLEIRFESIFSLKLGNIIHRGLRIILTRYKRRILKKWQTTQLKH